MKSRLSSAVLLLGSFILHFVGLGVSQSFGILYSELLDVFNSSKSETSWIASLNSALLLSTGSIAGIAIKYYGFRKVAILGSIVASVGMATSVFVPSIYYLYLTYGLVTGIGMGTFYFASDIVVPIAFDRRRSVATAFATSGGSIGNVVIPLLTSVLLEHYGWRGTFLILSGIIMQGVIAGSMLNVDVIETEKDNRTEEKLTFVLKSIFSNFGFLLLLVSGSSVTLGYFIPYFMFPDFAKEKGYNNKQAALIITISGIAGIIGRLAIGFLSDLRWTNRFVLNGSILMIGGCCTILVIYMKQHLLTWYMVYGAVLGVFTGGFAFIQPLLTTDLLGKDYLSVAFGMVLLLQGICSLIGPPIAGLITDTFGRYDEAFIFAGCLFIFGGITSALIPLHKRINSSKSYKVDT